MKITFTPIMHQILQLLPNSKALRYLLLAGKEFGGEEASKLDIVDKVFPEPFLFEKAMELAHTLAAKDRRNLYHDQARHAPRSGRAPSAIGAHYRAFRLDSCVAAFLKPLFLSGMPNRAV